MLTIISSAHAFNRLSLALDGVRRQHARDTALGLLRKAVNRVIRWQERAHERRHLIGMDDRLLADIGLSRADVQSAFDKPFWRC